MSKVIQKLNGLNAQFVEAKGNLYYIDSRFTMDHGYETMVFEVKDREKALNGDENGVDWGGIYAETYKTLEEMLKNHEFLLENLETVLEN